MENEDTASPIWWGTWPECENVSNAHNLPDDLDDLVGLNDVKFLGSSRLSLSFH
jgi:hypothetical protein